DALSVCCYVAAPYDDMETSLMSGWRCAQRCGNAVSLPAISLLMVLALFAGVTPTRSAGAQVSETPTSFDTAGTVRGITPSLATRLGLAPPTWPVPGDFVEARLFTVSTGGYVIVVERRDGRLDRFPLSADDAAALRRAV